MGSGMMTGARFAEVACFAQVGAPHGLRGIKAGRAIPLLAVGCEGIDRIGVCWVVGQEFPLKVNAHGTDTACAPML